MSERTSPQTRLKYGVELVCTVWRFPCSSFYQASLKKSHGFRGKRPMVSDEMLLQGMILTIVTFKERAIAKFMPDFRALDCWKKSSFKDHEEA